MCLKLTRTMRRSETAHLLATRECRSGGSVVHKIWMCLFHLRHCRCRQQHGYGGLACHAGVVR